MKKILFAIMIIVLFSSCNWNIMTSSLDEVNVSGNGSDTIALFDGSAPRNVYASQARHDGEVVLSFNGVSGADYYVVERAVIDKARNVPESEYDWSTISVIRDDEGSANSFFYHDSKASDGSKIYLYRVKAESLYAQFPGNVRPQSSDVARGWPLSPPVSLTVSQGEYDSKIVLEWTQIDLVRGYNVYMKAPDMNVYSLVNTDGYIPAAVHADTMRWEYSNIPDEYDGEDIDFYVKSVSRGEVESAQSGIRTGYTFEEGAPLPPQDLQASDAYSTKYITIRWEKPVSEGTDGSYYKWEIYRSTPTSDQVLVSSFTTGNNLDGNYYEYKDESNSLEGGVEYTYTVRAIYVKPSADGSSAEEILGRSASDTGRIIDSSVKITVHDTDFENDIFSFDITPPSYEITCAAWEYVIYGRRNDLGTIELPWAPIARVHGENGVTIPIQLEYGKTVSAMASRSNLFGCGEYNEFDVRIADADGEETASYVSEYGGGESIVPGRAEAPSASILNLSQNRWRSDLRAVNDVYPVILSINDPERDDAVYEIEAFTLNAFGESVDHGTKSGITEAGENGSGEYILNSLSPSEIGEKWYYRIRRSDDYGRFSEWSTERDAASERSATGYGAVTGNALIKFFEAYAMKPWEFINHADFPQNLKTKWSSSEIRNYILTEATSADKTEYSDYHGGSIHYNVTANMAAMAGDISFSYSNFGELESIYTESGSYTMRVSLSGNGSIAANTPFIIKGMYPATILIDSSHMSVSGKAFRGHYVVRQDNGMSEELVEATKN